VGQKEKQENPYLLNGAISKQNGANKPFFRSTWEYFDPKYEIFNA